MNGTTPWYLSHGMWGAILTVLIPVIGGALHLTLDAGTVSQLSDAAAVILTVVAGIVAAHGRATATLAIAPIGTAAVPSSTAPLADTGQPGKKP